jgi:hypothetical protein
MTERPQPAPVATPIHLWIIGGLGTVWGAFGCVDFLLINIRHLSYIARLSPDVIDALDALPGWVVVGWAMQMGFGLLGSLLLLARSRWSVHAFVAALFGLVAHQGYQFAVGLPAGMISVGAISMLSATWIIAIARLVYSRRMRARGVLR